MNDGYYMIHGHKAVAKQGATGAASTRAVMKPHLLVILSALAVLAAGCASDPASTDRDYGPQTYIYGASPQNQPGNGERQAKIVVPRNPPEADAIVRDPSIRRGEEHFAAALGAKPTAPTSGTPLISELEMTDI
jgi:hypothetical protein